MSANTSQRKARTTVLASHGQAFRTWFLVAAFGACARRAHRMTDCRIDLTMHRLLLRLRCRACGKPPASAAIDNAVPGHLRRVVTIWAPGTYGGPWEAHRFPQRRLPLFGVGQFRPARAVD